MNVLVDLNNCIYLPKTGIKDINTLSGSTADAWQENVKFVPRLITRVFLTLFPGRGCGGDISGQVIPLAEVIEGLNVLWPEVWQGLHSWRIMIGQKVI